MKRLILLIIAIIPFLASFSQLPGFQGTKSPNVFGLGTYGNVPVNYYTGIPDISIPVYKMKSGSISLPISLRYHPGSVKPNEHPGWVGLGWNLDCYGVINRVVHGATDESYDEAYEGGNSYMSEGTAALEASDWDSPSNMQSYYEVNEGGFIDHQADEFYFNFLGYSGKFMYTYDGWKVISDHNIKVEDGDTMTFSEVNSIFNSMPVNINRQSDLYPQLKEFILTTEDGTKYYFGGTNAVEFTHPYIDVQLNRKYLWINAWYLKKIADVNGNEIVFTYQTGYPVCKLSYYAINQSMDCYVPSMWGNFMPSGGWSLTGLDTIHHSGYIVFPIYLSSISGKNEDIFFRTSESSELRYTHDYFHKFDLNTINYFTWLSSYPEPEHQIRWEKLDSVIVKSKDAEVKHQFKFSYSNTSNERLTLASFYEISRQAVQPFKYTFNYNNIAGLPDYGGDHTDAWGYFNGFSICSVNWGVIEYYKKTNAQYSDARTSLVGLLNKIIYPTGGYTKFYWEPNIYSQVVSSTRESLTDVYEETVPKYCGSVRIKKMSHYNTATDSITKDYFYIANYAGSTNHNPNARSSGILNGTPQFYFHFTRNGIQTPITVDYRTVDDMASYSYNANGSHIGYSEVGELDKDGSFTRYLYTNYGSDIHGGSHFDRSCNTIGWVGSEDQYYPHSTVEKERGKILRIEKYNINSVLVDSTSFYYDNNANRFNNYLRRYEVRNSYGCTDYYALVFAQGYKEYTYRYNLIKKTNTLFDINGQNPITTETNYQYNSLDQIVSETITNSDNQTITNYTTYPGDFASGTTFIDNLVTNHVLNVPIELVSTRTNGTTVTIINGKNFTYYTGGKGLIEKEYLLELTKGQPIALSLFKFSNKSTTGQLPLLSYGSFGTYSRDSKFKEKTYFNTYDSYGNPLLITPVNNISNSFIWGHNGELLIAKSVVDASNAAIAYSGFEDANDKGNWTYTGSPAAAVIAKAGRKCYHLGTASITKSLPSGKYRLQYFAKASITISGGTVTDIFTSTADANGWIHYEKEINITSNPTTITLSGSAYVDEVRVFPSAAQMTSYTYDPVFGVSSENDENNVIRYYEYDEFGRLKTAKDQDGNIIRNYDYHYKTSN